MALCAVKAISWTATIELRGVSRIRGRYNIDWKSANEGLQIKIYRRKLSIEVWLETAEKRMKFHGFFSSFGRFYPGNILSEQISRKQKEKYDAGNQECSVRKKRRLGLYGIHDI